MSSRNCAIIPKTFPEPSFTSNKGKLLFGRQALPLLTRFAIWALCAQLSQLSCTHHEISEAGTPSDKSAVAQAAPK